MRSVFTRLTLAACATLALTALAPAASGQTSIVVDRKGGNMIPTRFTVELRDASGKISGQSVIDHPGMGIRAVIGYVPAAQVRTLENAVTAADLLLQAGDEWSGASPDVSTQTFTDENGNYSILHPMTGPHGVDATPEMLALAQAMSAAQAAFVMGSTPPVTASPFLSYTYAGGWIGQVTLDVATDGSCHLYGSGARFNGIDMKGQLSQSDLGSLKTYMTRYAAAFKASKGWGKFFPDGIHETITYTDASGKTWTVTRWGTASAGSTWTHLRAVLRTESLAIDPAVKF